MREGLDSRDTGTDPAGLPIRPLRCDVSSWCLSSAEADRLKIWSEDAGRCARGTRWPSEGDFSFDDEGWGVID
jgi:hypothetical protein